MLQIEKKTQDWEFRSHQYRLEKGAQKKKKKGHKRSFISTRGFRIGSPIQAGTPPNRSVVILWAPCHQCLGPYCLGRGSPITS